MSTPPYWPDHERVGLVTVDDAWAAVSLPADWAPIILAILGGLGGPVWTDPGLTHWLWPVPPGGAEDWPDLTPVGVMRHGPGDLLLVPGSIGHNGVSWVRRPTPEGWFTHAPLLRDAAEFILGPLEDAVRLGPVTVCRYCGAPIRRGVLIDSHESLSGPGWDTYACGACFTSTVGGGDARHLHAVRPVAR